MVLVKVFFKKRYLSKKDMDITIWPFWGAPGMKGLTVNLFLFTKFNS